MQSDNNRSLILIYFKNSPNKLGFTTSLYLDKDIAECAGLSTLLKKFIHGHVNIE